MNKYIVDESNTPHEYVIPKKSGATVSENGVIRVTKPGKFNVTTVFGKFKLKLKVIVS